MLEKRNRRSQENFANALKRYLDDTLHEGAHVYAFENPTNLPAFITRIYDLYEARLFGRRCVFLAAGKRYGTPSDIAKHVGLVRSAVGGIVVFAAGAVSAHNRSRLIAQGVAFVVPGNQLYIPELAMDLREHFRASRLRPAGGLSPAAQAILFQHLLRREDGATTPSAIAKRLGYSAMSIGRAFDDLVVANLAKTEKHGKERHLEFNVNGRALLEAARNFLRSPVRSVKYMRNGLGLSVLKLAGESALSELTDLSPPSMKTYAIAASEWKAFAKDRGDAEVDESEADFAIETWSYDPAVLSERSVVDSLSLYAEFRNHRDERILIAAEQLLENLSW